jgi:5-hydroxyisourate hydrolase-like protein (transthyretin family)
MSVPVFSNSLTKQNTNGTISGSVRSSVGNIAIAGATVSAGQFSATTMASGFYNLSLPAGTYTVTATHPNFTQVSHEDIVVVFGENTTLNFIMTPTSNEDVVEITVTALNSNYPNPFNPETTISYDIKEPGKVRLDVFNLKGQLVRTLVNDEHSTGRYNVVFNATDDRGNKLSSGLYFYRLRAGDYIKTRKMMLME